MIKTFALITMLGIVVVSCSEDEEPAKARNYFTVDGVEYSLSEGLTIEYGGAESSGYNFDLYVISSGLDASDIDDSGMSGTGDAMYFELWSTSRTGLVSGTYTVSDEALPNTFTASDMVVNWVTETGDVDAEYEASAGTVKISVDGSNYDIDFDLTVTGGKKLIGNYTGTLPNY